MLRGENEKLKEKIKELNKKNEQNYNLIKDIRHQYKGISEENIKIKEENEKLKQTIKILSELI